jgi:hypothetical protein
MVTILIARIVIVWNLWIGNECQLNVVQDVSAIEPSKFEAMSVKSSVKSKISEARVSLPRPLKLRCVDDLKARP